RAGMASSFGHAYLNHIGYVKGVNVYLMYFGCGDKEMYQSSYGCAFGLVPIGGGRITRMLLRDLHKN
ncbi:MAG TPA: hypothetical protein VHA37_05030, partial [Candidatus Saccharimonadales bacterium]|nr:hypothetical protein [Candidatus Saccharimonadales bacterium]